MTTLQADCHFGLTAVAQWRFNSSGMRGRKIIFMTRQYDLNADAVIIRLREMGQLPVRVNLEDFFSTSHAQLTMETRGTEGFLRTENRLVPLAEIRSVWCRKFERRSSGGDLLQQLAEQESEQALGIFLYALECFWMNHPWKARDASYAAAQLLHGAKAGFPVPSTLITSDATQAEAFAQRHGGTVVFKAMGPREIINPPVAERDQIIRIQHIQTALVLQTEIARDCESIQLGPCLFQQVIPAQVTVRAFVVEKEVFAVESAWTEVDTPVLPSIRTAVDLQTAHLPDDVAARCLAYATSLDLTYTAIDLIRDVDGRYHFLGGDANADFWWIAEKLPDVPIAEAIAASLLRGGR